MTKDAQNDIRLKCQLLKMTVIQNDTMNIGAFFKKERIFFDFFYFSLARYFSKSSIGSGLEK